jgi:hypothetical protein
MLPSFLWLNSSTNSLRSGLAWGNPRLNSGASPHLRISFAILRDLYPRVGCRGMPWDFNGGETREKQENIHILDRFPAIALFCNPTRLLNHGEDQIYRILPGKASLAFR